jgi:xylulokinase
MALLGMDLGTSGVKVLVLGQDGTTLAVAQASYAVQAPQPEWTESDPPDWWRATVVATHAALVQAGDPQIAAIGVCGQMHGVVLVDAAMQVVRPAILWADARATAALARYRMVPEAHHAALANPLAPGMAGPILLWLAEHEPAHYAQARWAMQPKDWLRLCLTGTVASDPSDASATLLYDLPHDRWFDEVIADLGLRRELLPTLLPSATVAGYLTTNAATEFGLPSGIPVATGAADTPAGALGTGLLASGVIQLSLGTGAQMIEIVDQPTPDPQHAMHLYRAATAQGWYLMAAVQNGGLALDWVRDLFGITWDDLFASAASAPDPSDDLLFLPYLVGERSSQPNISPGGAWLGMRRHHTRANLLHAALVGVACGMRRALECLPDAASAPSLRLVGGGSVHPAWRQLLADILGRELLAVDVPAASARGAALLAGIAISLWPSAEATATFPPMLHPVATPDPRQAVIYQAIYQRYLNHISFDKR